MVKLFAYPRGVGMPNASPFCMKLETWLRMNAIEYAFVPMLDPRKAPMGKLPMIEHAGNQVPDSDCIIDYLQQSLGIHPDEGLDETQRAISHAFKRMLEEHSYWGIVCGRWQREQTWLEWRQTAFDGIPPLVKPLISKLVRKQVVRDARGHGLARQPEAEILRRIGQDMDAVAAQLGSKTYFLDDKPRNIDATVYAFVGNLLHPQLNWPQPDLVRKHDNLVAYCDRMRDQYFGDL